MRENFKTVTLILLVLCSVGLTYHIWFGASPLKESAAPRYEYAHFVEQYSRKEIVTPSLIVFEGEEEDVFRRGEGEYKRLWKEGGALLGRLGRQTFNRISEAEMEVLLEMASSKTIFMFMVPLPVTFFLPEFTPSELNICRIFIIWEEHYYYVILEGEEIFTRRVFMDADEQLLGNLRPRESCRHLCLPDRLIFDLPGNNFLEPGEGDIVNLGTAGLPVGESDGPGLPIRDVKEDGENVFCLKLKDNRIFVPLDSFAAAELSLQKEKIDKEELVRAFFLDPSIARLIEERDGATFFTDGEKGLRIYPDGLVEYTAPGLVHIPPAMPYSAALQKGAENLRLFGGWQPGIHLTRVEMQSEGYRLFWETFYAGLPLVGRRAGTELVINEIGVFYYQRDLYHVVGEIGEKGSFRPFDEALAKAVLIYRESYPENEGILLGIEPVYYFSVEGMGTAKAVPAWSVSISGLGTMYLHWQTLEPL